MDFDEFEQLVLKVLFETDVPVTAAHVAYLGRTSVRTAEKHLARMVEHGTLNVRTNAAGVVEYVYPGRKPIAISACTKPIGSSPLTARKNSPIAGWPHVVSANSSSRSQRGRSCGAGRRPNTCPSVASMFSPSIRTYVVRAGAAVMTGP